MKPITQECAKKFIDRYDRLLLHMYFGKRFKINYLTGCWTWTGPKAPHGYGAFFCSPYNKKLGTWRASRLSFIIFKNIHPGPLSVCHTCDNPICVNPEHLFLGTQRDNALDMMTKKRHPIALKTHCKNGHPLWGANLVNVKNKRRRVCSICFRKSAANWAARQPKSKLKEIKARAAKKFYEKKIKDPIFKEKILAKQRERYHKYKLNPEWVQKERDRSRNRSKNETEQQKQRKNFMQRRRRARGRNTSHQ